MTPLLVGIGLWITLALVGAWLWSRCRAEQRERELCAACDEAIALRAGRYVSPVPALIQDVECWHSPDAWRVDQQAALWGQIRVASVVADGKKKEAAWGRA